MKKLISICLILIISNSVLAGASDASRDQPKYSDYINTVWELKMQEDGDNLTIFRVKFNAKKVKMTFIDCNNNRDSKPCRSEVLIGLNPKVVPETEEYVAFIASFNKKGEPNINLHIYDDYCLLLPDSSAPLDCFRRVK